MPIALKAARELHVERTDIFHSEHPESCVFTNNPLPDTASYDRLFNWIVFLGLPTLVTVKFVWPALCNLDDKLSEHILEILLSFLTASGCLYLLLRMLRR